ncbi:MAG: hypothetical protein IJN94_04450 [Clostridia bacterium]|nr:hypothetical protein [Clostridia bacterium]
MRFKIRNTEFRISFSFFALLLLFLTTDISYIFVFVFALAHEVIHLIFINMFSVAPKKVSFTLFGADILRESNATTSNNAEIIIHLSAPIFNLFLSGIFYVLYVLIKYRLFLFFTNINLALGIFNLIPFYNFDGGNALYYFFLKYFTNRTSNIIITCISVIITIVFSALAVLVFIKFKNNFSLLFISFYMIFSLILKK